MGPREQCCNPQTEDAGARFAPRRCNTFRRFLSRLVLVQRPRGTFWVHTRLCKRDPSWMARRQVVFRLIRISLYFAVVLRERFLRMRASTVAAAKHIIPNRRSLNAHFIWWELPKAWGGMRLLRPRSAPGPQRIGRRAQCSAAGTKSR